MSFKRISINNFGSFSNFIWNQSVLNKKNETEEFARMNVLYGRNYSGKTTLSRIFRSLETGVISEKFEHHDFFLSADSGQITHQGIPSQNYEVRVYNTDFVDENLSFLKHEQGNISAFAVIGKENKKLEQQIQNKLLEIGSNDESDSLTGKIFSERKAKTEAILNYQRADRRLNDLLTRKATNPDIGIKHNATYKDPNYNTPKLVRDIESISAMSHPILTQEEIQEKKSYLQQTSLPDINKPPLPTLMMESLIEQSIDLLSRKIRPTEAIQELLDDALLQSWVKSGIALHQPDRKSCGFCGNPIPNNLWDKLSNHFSEESEKLEQEINTLIGQIKTEAQKVENIEIPQQQKFYPSFYKDAEHLKINLLNKRRFTYHN